jgi:peptidyl-prolyl cis-trans isomerase C
MRAKHILVSTLQEAMSLKTELMGAGTGGSNGVKFEDLATKYSKCPSGRNGGDLGEFGPGQMVKPFEDATLATPIGMVSQPVQTQFGWHLIKRVS